MSEEQSFNPREHLMMIKNRQGATEYLPVQWRLVWFRQQCPGGTIETEIIHLDLDKMTQDESFVWNSEKRRSEKTLKEAPGIAVVRAVVRDGKGGVATGTKMEKAASFGDFLEKAETGAIGRALAELGFGTQFTADELDERHRIVDAPVDQIPSNGSNGSTNGAAETVEGSITEQQLASIRKLCQHLDKAVPEGTDKLSFSDAKKRIQRLTQEYRENKATPTNEQEPKGITGQQLERLQKLYPGAGEPLPADLKTFTYEVAGRHIQRLSSKQKAAAR